MLPNRPHGAILADPSAHAADGTRCQRHAVGYCAWAKAAVAAVGTMHRYAAQQVATALAAVETLVQTAQHTEPLAAGQVTALSALRQEFLRAVLLSVQAAGVTLITELRHGQPLSQLAAQERQHIDQLVAQYVHQVHKILRR